MGNPFHSNLSMGHNGESRLNACRQRPSPPAVARHNRHHAPMGLRSGTAGPAVVDGTTVRPGISHTVARRVPSHDRRHGTRGDVVGRTRAGPPPGYPVHWRRGLQLVGLNSPRTPPDPRYCLGETGNPAARAGIRDTRRFKDFNDCARTGARPPTVDIGSGALWRHRLATEGGVPCR